MCHTRSSLGTTNLVPTIACQTKSLGEHHYKNRLVLASCDVRFIATKGKSIQTVRHFQTTVFPLQSL